MGQPPPVWVRFPKPSPFSPKALKSQRSPREGLSDHHLLCQRWVPYQLDIIKSEKLGLQCSKKERGKNERSSSASLCLGYPRSTVNEASTKSGNMLIYGHVHQPDLFGSDMCLRQKSFPIFSELQGTCTIFVVVVFPLQQIYSTCHNCSSDKFDKKLLSSPKQRGKLPRSLLIFSHRKPFSPLCCGPVMFPLVLKQ